jgi:opacity protein-like surface antigen
MTALKARWVSSLLMVCALAGATAAQARSRYDRPGYEHYGNDQSVRMRLGLFTPDGKSDFFDDTGRDFTGDVKDLEDVVGGLDYVFQVQRNVGIMLSADYYEGQQDQSYRNFEDNFGHRISHTTTFDVVPLTVGIKVDLAPPSSPIVPYVGAGGGLYTWRYEERGDFIDFGTSHRDVFSSTLEDDGAALGYFVMAGLEVPISPYFSVLAEARWDRADDELGGDFEDLGTIDLGGRRVMGGLAWRF